MNSARYAIRLTIAPQRVWTARLRAMSSALSRTRFAERPVSSRVLRSQSTMLNPSMVPVAAMDRAGMGYEYRRLMGESIKDALR